MLRHLGYVVVALSLDASTAQTCRLANATPVRLRTLIAANLENLERVLAFNAARDVRLYRISSDVVPFASHEVNRLRWWQSFAPRLRRLGAFVRRHRMRVSMHPGPFTVLNSLDAPGGGGIGAGAPVARPLPRRARDRRLVEDRDPRRRHGGWTGGGDGALRPRRADAAERGAPAAHRRERRAALHGRARARGLAPDRAARGLRLAPPPREPGLGADARETSGLVAACFDTWGPADGVPKIHLSSQARGARRGCHGDRVRASDFLDFLAVAPARPFDCMIEAKKKDLVLFRLRRELRQAGVIETAANATPDGAVCTSRVCSAIPPLLETGRKDAGMR